MVAIPSQIDDHVIDADLILPPGVQNLKEAPVSKQMLYTVRCDINVIALDL